MKCAGVRKRRVTPVAVDERSESASGPTREVATVAAENRVVNA